MRVSMCIQCLKTCVQMRFIVHRSLNNPPSRRAHTFTAAVRVVSVLISRPMTWKMVAQDALMKILYLVLGYAVLMYIVGLLKRDE